MPHLGAMPPAARQMMLDSVKRTLAQLTDPAQREMVLAQYRAMGIEFTPEELA